MSMEIKYTVQARSDIKSINDYISYSLFAPETAQKQVQRILKFIRTLSDMPFMYKLYDTEKWGNQGLRAMPVDNYMVFYIAKKDKNEVWIIRVIYGKRNIETQLKNTEM